MVILVFIALGANLPWRASPTSSLRLSPWSRRSSSSPGRSRSFARLLPDRRGSWSREELIFLAWTRETGVVPAALAGIVVGLHVPHAELVVTTVALAIVVTLAVQATTKRWLARRLGLLVTARCRPTVDPAARPAPAGGRCNDDPREAVCGDRRHRGRTGFHSRGRDLGDEPPGDRFDNVQRAADARLSPWSSSSTSPISTGGRPPTGTTADEAGRPISASFAKFKRDFALARTQLRLEREQAILDRIERTTQGEALTRVR